MSPKEIRTTLLLLAAWATAFGDTLVVPSAEATAAGNASGQLSSAAVRVQEVVGSGQFPGPITIIGLRFRAAPGTGSISTPPNSIKLTLSTTQAYPNTANGHALLSATYANNIGPDATVVFNGSGTISSPGCALPGPCPFDIAIPFTTPFSYDPSKGRLLIDYTTGASQVASVGRLDLVTFPDSTSSTVAVMSSDPSQPTAANGGPGGLVLGLDTATATYYFPQIAIGGGWQTTVTYVDYAPQGVTCQTSFYADSGLPLMVPFGGAFASTRTDALAAGGTLHEQTAASVSAATVSGWARALCSGPIKASVLYRIYNSQHVAQGEAGVNATVTPTTEFVTFAETSTGIAYANPSSTATANVTITALNTAGVSQGSKTVTLGPNAHGAINVGPFLGLNSITGSVQITSDVPIVSLSLNAEAFPVFSALPPGDLPASTPLATGH